MASTSAGPGILVLASRILDDSSALSPLDFARWGERTCVPSVQATGGISHTVRYESVNFMRQHRSSATDGGRRAELSNSNFPFDFLDIYFMEDAAFRDNEAFNNLPIIGNAEMSGNIDASRLLERLLMLTEFNVRFCSLVDTSEDVTAPLFLITLRTNAAGQTPSNLPGQVIGRYEIETEKVLSALERSDAEVQPGDELVLLGVNSLSTATTALQSLRSTTAEVGLWGLRKEYDGSERTPEAWRPGIRI